MTSKKRQMHAAKSNGRDHPYVERRPGVRGGEPAIVGTRAPVRSVVTNIYRLGMTPEEMVEAWPYLTLAHVHDALSFYHGRAGDLDADRKVLGGLARRRRDGSGSEATVGAV